MNFPTTTEEALAVSPEKAEELMDVLFDTLDEIMDEYDPGEDFIERQSNFMLAAVIDTLNRVSQLPDQPFGPDGWVSMLPPDVMET